MPYLNLAKGSATADASILLPYGTDPYTALGTAARHRSTIIAGVAATTVLGDFLPLLLANVPFDRVSTITTLEWCMRFSIGILAFMAAVAVALLVQLSRHGARWGTALAGRASVLREAPVAGYITVAAASDNLTASLGEGLSGLGTHEMRRRIRGMGSRYEWIERIDRSGTARGEIRVLDSEAGYH